MGIGNWTVGVIESSKYQALLYKTGAYWLGRKLPKFSTVGSPEKNEEVLRRN